MSTTTPASRLSDGSVSKKGETILNASVAPR
jgi:hypothetical protein